MLQTMLQEAIWTQALLGAMDEYLHKKTGGIPVVVPAAPLKPLLIRHAEQRGLRYLALVACFCGSCPGVSSR